TAHRRSAGRARAPKPAAIRPRLRARARRNSRQTDRSATRRSGAPAARGIAQGSRRCRRRVRLRQRRNHAPRFPAPARHAARRLSRTLPPAADPPPHIAPYGGPRMIPADTHLQIGALLFEGIDQIDLTGPFEVLSRLPNSTYRIFGKGGAAVRDGRGLRLAPDAALAEAPKLDVLHIPGGFGQEALMDDEEVLGWVRRQADGARL